MPAYTNEQTVEMVEIYSTSPSRETVAELAEKYGKSEKSIIGKLSKEGVYKREVYKSKTGDLPVLKNAMVADIAGYLEVEVEDLSGLEKTPKQTLKIMLEAMKDMFG